MKYKASHPAIFFHPVTFS